MSPITSFFICCMISFQGYSHDAFNQVKGKWIIKKVIPTNNVVALSQDEVDELIGTTIIYERSRLITKNFAIESPKYSVAIMTNEKFQDEFAGFPLVELGISSSKVVLITITSSKEDIPEFFGDTLLKDGNKVIVEFKGVYFLLSRK